LAYYIMPFAPGVQDLDFERSATPAEGVQEMIETIRERK